MLKKLLSVFLCTAILLGNLAMVSFAEETEDIVEPVAESVTDVSHSDAEDQVSAESAEEYSVTWTNPFVSVSMELREDAVAVAIPLADDQVYHENTATAGAELKAALKNRVETVAIGYRVTAEQLSNDAIPSIMDEIFNVACEHSGVPDEGDYLRWHIGGWNCSVESMVPGSDGTYYDTVMVYQFLLNSTAAEEAVMDQQVDVLLASLNTTGTDYEKIKAIYDWICNNVNYDYVYLDQLSQSGTPDLSKHSAHAALVQRMTVCQGYSNLLYRLALKVGIECRIITGISHGESHSWNIVKIDGQYYNLDSTWDTESKKYGGSYEYFLKCEANFPDHARDGEYLTESFMAQYPIAATDYNAHADACEYVDGDFTFLIEDGKATLTAYTGHAKEVTIPGTANGAPVSMLGANAFTSNATLETVTIPASVITIETGLLDQTPYPYVSYGTFAKCPNLTKVVFAEGSKLETIGEWAFHKCEKLTQIQLPASVRTLELSSFEGCKSLTAITLPEGIQLVGQNAFTGSGLRKIVIPASCTFFHFFNDMPMLEEFAVAEGNHRYRTHEGVLYDNQPPTGNYSGWTLIGYPHNKSGDSYRVADFCTHIFGDIFTGDRSMPTNLKTLYIRNADASVAVDSGISLSRIRFRVVPDDTNPHFVSRNNMLFTRDMKTLVQVPSDLTGTIVVPEGVTYVESYAAEWGSYSSIIFPESLTQMGGAVFWYTNSVESIYIPASVTKVTGSSVFMDCNNLQDVYFGGTEAQWEAAFNPSDKNYPPLYLAPHFKLHYRSSATVQEPTCEANGTIAVKCGDCGKNQVQTAQALGHETSAKPVFDPTTKTHSVKCTRCGGGAATEQCLFGEGKIVVEATAKNKGIKEYTCVTCGGSYRSEYTLDDNDPVYRLYNPYTLEHLLVSNEVEKVSLVSVGWTLEGIAWNAPKEGSPVYRLYNPDDWHTYTSSEEEMRAMVAAGWSLDGPVSCAADADQTPVYRLFNPYEKINYHLFTASVEERDFLVSLGWILEGVAWYAEK